MKSATFGTVLLAIVAVAAIASLHDGLAVVQSTTRVDNLEITGATDATGVVTARAGVRLTTPTTGPIFTSGSGVPAGAATIGSLYLRTDTAQLYQNTDGATTWSQLGSGGGSTAAAATVTFAARPASVVLTTEGTVDWLYLPFVNPSQTAANSLYASINGGWLAKSYAWKPGWSATQTADAVGTTYTATVAGSQNPNALSTTFDATYHNNSGNTNTFGGWTFRVPMRATGQRRVRVYAWHRTSTITITARASDGSMTPVTATNVAAASAVYLVEIVYSGQPGTELVVTAETSAGTAAYPAFGVGAITVADI